MANQPKGERERRSVRLPVELGERLKERAEREDKTENDIIVLAVELYLSGTDSKVAPLSIQPGATLGETAVKVAPLSENPHGERDSIARHGDAHTSPPALDWRTDLAALGPNPGGHNEPYYLWRAKRDEYVARWQGNQEALDAVKADSLFLLRLEEKRAKLRPAPKRLSTLLDAHEEAPEVAPLPKQAPAPTPLPNCEHCDNVRFVMVESGSYVSAQSCPVCALDCLSCGGRGHFVVEEFGYEKVVPCACEDRSRRRRTFDAAKIPALYRARLFGSSKSPSGYKATMTQHAAYEKLAAWLKNYESGARGLVLYGPIGTAKTTLLCRLLARLSLQRGVGSRFVEWSLLIEQTKETFGEDEPNPLLPLQHVPVVVIDELGKRAASSEWQQEQLDVLLSARYQNKHTTLYSTNLHPTESKNGVPSLKDRIGARLFDRLVERCEFVEVAGVSMRPVLARGVSQDA